MKNWNSIKKLHIEISSKCNAACPMCNRYPTASYYEHPFIQDDWMWTLADVKQRLPAEDLVGINSYLINGTIGDFIVNPEALEIIQYLHECSPQAGFYINTNGSARSSNWWKALATIPKVIVNFAIDGLADTHSLYRRNTNWSTIISNAKTFMEAGGQADWTMTVFEHNKHQIDECFALSKSLGFKTFVNRNSERPNVMAINKDGQPSHWIKSPDLKNPDRPYNTVVIKEKEYKKNIFFSYQILKSKPLPSTNFCESISQSSIYIGSNWAVVPCCNFGALTVNKQLDRRWNNFVKALSDNNLNLNDFFATNTKTVRQVFEQGFDWIYDRILTDDALVTCYVNCHPTDSTFQRSKQSLQKNILIK